MTIKRIIDIYSNNRPRNVVPTTYPSDLFAHPVHKSAPSCHQGINKKHTIVGNTPEFLTLDNVGETLKASDNRI